MGTDVSDRVMKSQSQGVLRPRKGVTLGGERQADVGRCGCIEDRLEQCLKRKTEGECSLLKICLYLRHLIRFYLNAFLKVAFSSGSVRSEKKASFSGQNVSLEVAVRV